MINEYVNALLVEESKTEKKSKTDTLWADEIWNIDIVKQTVIHNVRCVMWCWIEIIYNTH